MVSLSDLGMMIDTEYFGVPPSIEEAGWNTFAYEKRTLPVTTFTLVVACAMLIPL
jgi:hypothetical protein